MLYFKTRECSFTFTLSLPCVELNLKVSGFGSKGGCDVQVCPAQSQPWVRPGTEDPVAAGENAPGAITDSYKSPARRSGWHLAKHISPGQEAIKRQVLSVHFPYFEADVFIYSNA